MHLISKRGRAHSTRIAPLYLANLFLALHYALLIYINSSFLKRFFSEQSVGLLYVCGAIINLIVLLNAKKVLRHISTRNLLLSLVGIEALSIFIMLGADNALAVGLAFVAHLVAVYKIVYCLDLYLEAISKDTQTGTIRTQYLTAANSMIALAPLITGWLVFENDYSLSYIFSILLLAPLAVVIMTSFRLMFARTPARRDRPETFATFLHTPSLHSAFASRLLLEFFYSWMVIYTPIYLNVHIGLEWHQIGIIFSIMLLAFVFFEIPAGRLADSRYGEKEMLSLGFVIISVFTFLLPFIPASASIAIWAGALFMTRVGASLIESMTETYFFKNVDATHEDYIGFYRTSQPLAHIAGPLAATVTLAFLPMSSMFVVLACVMATGLRYSLAMKDTR